MPRTPVLCALTVALSLLVLATPAGAQRPPLRASLDACEDGAGEDARFAVFKAQMPALARTERMWMRFDLYRRATGRRTWRRVWAPGAGRWLRSDPGRSGFAYTLRVERLAERVDLRATVRFRWYRSDGTLQRSARRRTRACRQPDQRADLVPGRAVVLPGPEPGTIRYVLGVANEGRAAAGPFEVRLRGEGLDVVRTVAGLPAGEQSTLEVLAPACAAGTALTVEVDPQDAVDESSERNNTQSERCGGR